MKQIVVSEIKNATCIVKLNNPDNKNALSVALRDELSNALDEIAGNPKLKVVILTGVGNVFSAGFDLNEFQKAAGDTAFEGKLWSSSDRFHHTILHFPFPIIAAVNGPAIAGGFDLALMCDIRIATSSTYFSHPEMSFGDVIYSTLHDLVNGATARELCLTGRKVTSKEAQKLGLVTKVVSAQNLMTEAEALAKTIAKHRHNLQRTKAKIIARAAISGQRTLDL